MMKKILLIIFSLQAKSITYIQKWDQIQFNEPTKLSELILANNCTPLKKQIEILKQKNRIETEIMPKNILIQNCLVEERFSDAELNVQEWKEVIIGGKDNISSMILANDCVDIYSKQIPEFEKRNNINNSDLLMIGQKVQLQSCLKKEIIKPKKNKIKNERREFYSRFIMAYNASLLTSIQFYTDKFLLEILSNDLTFQTNILFEVLNNKNFILFSGIGFSQNIGDGFSPTFNVGIRSINDKFAYSMSFYKENLQYGITYKMFQNGGISFNVIKTQEEFKQFPGLFFTF